jgi:hypothetical protein
MRETTTHLSQDDGFEVLTYRLHLQGRRVSQERNVPPKRRLIFTGLHGVISQKTEIFSFRIIGDLVEIRTRHIPTIRHICYSFSKLARYIYVVNRTLVNRRLCLRYYLNEVNSDSGEKTGWKFFTCYLGQPIAAVYSTKKIITQFSTTQNNVYFRSTFYSLKPKHVARILREQTVWERPSMSKLTATRRDVSCYCKIQTRKRVTDGLSRTEPRLRCCHFFRLNSTVPRSHHMCPKYVSAMWQDCTHRSVTLIFSLEIIVHIKNEVLSLQNLKLGTLAVRFFFK